MRSVSLFFRPEQDEMAETEKRAYQYAFVLRRLYVGLWVWVFIYGKVCVNIFHRFTHCYCMESGSPLLKKVFNALQEKKIRSKLIAYYGLMRLNENSLEEE